MTKLRVALAFWVIAVSGAVAEPDLVAKYTAKFNTYDGLSAASASLDFDHEVPDSQKLDVLIQIMNSEVEKDAQPYPEEGRDARPFYITQALVYCFQHDADLKWTEMQEKEVLKFADHPSPRIRMLVINFMEQHKSGAMKNQIVRFLKDPDDEVRLHAILRIRGLPNAKSIYQEYLKANADGISRKSYQLALRYSANDG